MGNPKIPPIFPTRLVNELLMHRRLAGTATRSTGAKLISAIPATSRIQNILCAARNEALCGFAVMV